MITLQRIINAVMPPQSYLNPADLERIGTGNLRRVAKIYNTFKYGALFRDCKKQYRERFDELIQGNGPVKTTPPVIEDGLALDTSKTLPYLNELLAEAQEYIAEKGMKTNRMADREFFRDIMEQQALSRFPSFLNFILSSEMITTVSRYLGYIPRLSTTVPPGVRLVESDINGGKIGVYKHSQFYHLDQHDTPMIFVIVLLRDVTTDCGPLTYLSASTSARAAKALRYYSRNSKYHVTDERMYSVINENEKKVLTYPAGTVLFMDSSRCFHYGSRDSTVTRYHMMYALASPCRTDFSQLFLKPRIFPVSDSDSELRKMILRRDDS